MLYTLHYIFYITLSLCGNEGVILYGLRSRDVKRY